MFHDIFGLHTGRHKQIADELAKHADFTVVIPDFFTSQSDEFPGGINGKEERGYGGGLPRFMYLLLTGKLKSFQRLHPWSPVCSNIWSKDILPLLQSSLKCTSLGLLSFCWGAYPSIHVAAESSIPVRGSVMFHPSFDRTSENFGEGEDFTRVI